MTWKRHIFNQGSAELLLRPFGMKGCPAFSHVLLDQDTSLIVCKTYAAFPEYLKRLLASLYKGAHILIGEQGIIQIQILST